MKEEEWKRKAMVASKTAAACEVAAMLVSDKPFPPWARRLAPIGTLERLRRAVRDE